MSRIHKTVAISLHPELRTAAQERADQLGFRTSFSAYVSKLIADDLRRADQSHEAPLTAEQAAAAIVRNATAGKPVSYAAPKRAKKPQFPQS